jgi:hypothetical protein
MTDWNNFDFVLEKVNINGYALQFTTDELKNNYKIVMKAVKNKGTALQFASDELKNNYNIVMEAVKKIVVLTNLHHINYKIIIKLLWKQ